MRLPLPHVTYEIAADIRKDSEDDTSRKTRIQSMTSRLLPRLAHVVMHKSGKIFYRATGILTELTVKEVIRIAARFEGSFPGEKLRFYELCAI